MLTARIRMHSDSMNESFDPFKLSVHSLGLVSTFDDISESYS